MQKRPHFWYGFSLSKSTLFIFDDTVCIIIGLELWQKETGKRALISFSSGVFSWDEEKSKRTGRNENAERGLQSFWRHWKGQHNQVKENISTQNTKILQIYPQHPKKFIVTLWDDVKNTYTTSQLDEWNQLLCWNWLWYNNTEGKSV